MNRLLREVSIRLRDDERAFLDLERLHLVTDVDDVSIRTDPEDDALKYRHKVIFGPEIRGQRDDRVFHANLLN